MEIVTVECPTCRKVHDVNPNTDFFCVGCYNHFFVYKEGKTVQVNDIHKNRKSHQ